MLQKIDNFLNSITMYRLVLYYLIFLLVIALVFSFFGLLPFTPISLIYSVTLLEVVSFLSNLGLAKIFRSQTNIESVHITALILALIITPTSVILLIFAAILAQASKYILNINKKHFFNPAAIAVVITGLFLKNYASWWIGTVVMFPFSLLGILIVRKIRRFDMVFYFFIAATVTSFISALTNGNINIVQFLKNTFIDSPILFFAFVMLTEPLTTPPTALLQSLYGAIIGILYVPIHIGVFFTSPEISLVFGNLFSFLVSPKFKLELSLVKKIKLTNNTYDFVFTKEKNVYFKAGQYLEWTLGHKNTDSRGNRRYFTIASSPTEKEIRIGIKFVDKASSFKKKILSLAKGDKIIASQLAGDFTLPKEDKKLVFIAGGIGITPFRSMIKYLTDTNNKRDIILIYSEKTTKDMVYKDIFNQAPISKVIYFETQNEGHLSEGFIREKIPDYKKRTFYVSGPQLMVQSLEHLLSELKIPASQIKLDYFPGF